MPVLNVSNVLVDFPFEPYACQEAYMSSVISALQNREHALLESPTGTGKTLCLLCASLAWQEDYKGKIDLHRVKSRHPGSAALSSLEEQMSEAVGSGFGDAPGSGPSAFAPAVPKVIYASRTHAQLSQAVQQLKGTAYRSARVSIVGSRDQLCLNEEVRSLDTNAAKVLHCRMRVRARTCEYYRNLESNKSASQRTDSILDIEELVSVGRERRCCPYYLARELKSSAEVVFMPYNYLLDARIRRLHAIDLANAVVIFDEAHNVEKVSEDAASVDLGSADVAMAIEELRALAEELHSMLASGDVGKEEEVMLMPETHLGPILALKAQLLELERALDRLEFGAEGLVRPGDFVFDLLQQADLTPLTYQPLALLVDKVLKFAASSSNHRLRRGGGLAKVDTFLQAVFGPEPVEERPSSGASLLKAQAAASSSLKAQAASFFRVFVRDCDSRSGARQRQLCFWCFSPGRAMSQLVGLGVHSLVLTSGTLYPLDAFKTGLGVRFGVELRNDHVIAKDQILVGAITHGPDGTRLNSSYQSRSCPNYQRSLGALVANLARLVPDGLLVFFPSYSLLSECLARWKEGEEFGRMSQHKAVIVEPRGKTEFKAAMGEFERRATAGGALFLGVARGKVSEGLDFSDAAARAVVVTGLPFAPIMDARVRLKMAFLDEGRVAGEGTQTGREWYKQDAWRAVNQAVGRVIRHRRDFGAVLLADERFASADAKAQLPAWMREQVRRFDKFGACVKELPPFFKAAGEKYPPPMSARAKRLPEEEEERPGSVFRRTSAATAVRRAGINEMLAPSLRRSQPDSVETVRMSLDYAGLRHTAPGPAEGLMGLLDRHEAQTAAPKAPTASPAAHTSQDPLERRLERLQKRRRLTVKEDVPQPAKEYVSRVRQALGDGSNDLREFKAAAEAYKRGGELSALKRRLVDTLVMADRPDLARQFAIFVRHDDKEDFERFCAQLGVPEKEEEEQGKEEEEEEEEEKENLVCLKCACPRSQRTIMLAAPCNHVCCFPCWRSIVEDGNKRCPKCHSFVRRRLLRKLKFAATQE